MTDIQTTIGRGRPAVLQGSLATRLRNIFLFASFAFVVVNLSYDLGIGGNPWKQGDWLIHGLAGDIRRGPFGTPVVLLSDVLRVSPLAIIGALQAGLLVLLYRTFSRLLDTLPDQGTALILSMTPGIFAVAWFADAQGSLRKELLAYAALVLVAHGVVSGRVAALIGGTLLFVVSTWAHEAMVLFGPTLLVLLALGIARGLDRRVLYGCGAFAAVCAALALAYAMRFPTVADKMILCQPLLDRGLDAVICDGAIRWMEHASSYGAAAVRDGLVPAGFLGSSTAYAASLLPLVVVMARLKRARVLIPLAFVAALPFLPLYPVAVDWGRWIAFHVFSVTIVLAAGLGSGVLVQVRPLRAPLVAGLALMALLISPYHSFGAWYGGVVRTLVLEASALLTPV